MNPEEILTISEDVTLMIMGGISGIDDVTVTENVALVVPILHISVFEDATVSENTAFFSPLSTMYQMVALVQNESYKIAYHLSVVGSVQVSLSGYSNIISGDEVNVSATFTHTNVNGSYPLAFGGSGSPASINVFAVSVKKITATGVDENPIAEFLVGNTDFGNAIVFRADTQPLQVQANPELYSNPLSIVTETERGTMMKAFVNLDDKGFYGLEDTVTKGVSIVDLGVHPNKKASPPAVQQIQVSYRDSSKQLCRLIQAAIITLPTKIDHSS